MAARLLEFCNAVACLLFKFCNCILPYACASALAIGRPASNRACVLAEAAMEEAPSPLCSITESALLAAGAAHKGRGCPSLMEEVISPS